MKNSSPDFSSTIRLVLAAFALCLLASFFAFCLVFFIPEERAFLVPRMPLLATLIFAALWIGASFIAWLECRDRLKERVRAGIMLGIGLPFGVAFFSFLLEHRSLSLVGWPLLAMSCVMVIMVASASFALAWAYVEIGRSIAEPLSNIAARLSDKPSS